MQLELRKCVRAAFDDNFPSEDLLRRIGPHRGEFLVVGISRIARAQITGHHPLIPSELRGGLLRREAVPCPRVERRDWHVQRGDAASQLRWPSPLLCYGCQRSTDRG